MENIKYCIASYELKVLLVGIGGSGAGITTNDTVQSLLADRLAAEVNDVWLILQLFAQ